MNTPIFDFVKRYAKEGAVRLHMPGHKGKPRLGCEPLDITEIDGADVLYTAGGIIAESEKNAAMLFESGATLYSTEGSSLCIKAMLALVSEGKPQTRILAARNAHKAFMYAAALLDLSVSWIGKPQEHLCECRLTPSEVRTALEKEHFDAVYLTSPDYLGQLADVAGIGAVCKEKGVPLLVDNAHGAYLAFLSPSLHPLALGADLCCDSAHKTLPTLTGGAYLHIAKDALCRFHRAAERMLSLFASTSPSYLTLASLDLTNAYLAEEMPSRLKGVMKATNELKARLTQKGYPVCEGEPLKLVLKASQMGYTGEELARRLAEQQIVAEFFDREFLVLMISPENEISELRELGNALLSIPPREALSYEMPKLPPFTPIISPRAAILGRGERIPVEDAEGRICGAPSVSCPPAVPIVISGERITREHIALLRFYGIETIDVVAES